MRRVEPWIAGVALLATCAAGCGDRNLILTVNVLSFLDASESSAGYSLPGGLPSTSFTAADREVNLLPGLDDATDVLTATVDVAATFDNQSGSATGSLLLYAVPGDSTLSLTTAPIASIPVSLNPGAITNVSARVESPALAEALVSDQARVVVRLVLDTTATPIGQFVQGTETLTQILATVITKKKV